ncbi:calcium/sodium antiporter [Legionella gresilensis]|uniref:calcium/sodium antiporter n=1 Tax=Legionella gresilensis TaxID=91823 RepID=UPI0010412400|nr:calcium/sodium antiporter [Legionella gresilensis]
MTSFFLILVNFAALLWSASHLVSGASGLAYYYRLPPLLIGFTLVALGTSAPEIMIGIRASFDGLADIAVGNAIGSNIANIGLVLGLIALIRPLKVQPSFLQREFPLLFIAMLFIYSLMLDGYISIIDSCLSLLVCLLFIGYLLYTLKNSTAQRQITEEFRQAVLRKHSFRNYVFSLCVGLIVVPISAKFLVINSSRLAHQFGLSDLFIGLTLTAIGSSLPELITSILAIRKGADDIAIGTILGANVFNLLAVLIFPGIIHPSLISHAILWRDMPVMLLTTLILLWINTRHKKITRWHGGLLILVYCCYIMSLIISATH